MLRIDGHKLTISVSHLASFSKWLEFAHLQVMTDREVCAIAEDMLVATGVAVEKIRDASDIAGLGLGKSCDRLINQLKRVVPLRINVPAPEIKLLMEYISNLLMALSDSLDTRPLYALDPKHAEYAFPDNPLFGEKVQDAFPSAISEIGEAAQCRALGRWTACVMHLMRALEPALIALQAAVQVNVPKEQWSQVLDQVEAKIKEIRKASHGKNEEQWYSEAASHFRFIKDAWRNHAQHLHERYDEERAVEIYGNVRSFMRHLATRLSE